VDILGIVGLVVGIIGLVVAIAALWVAAYGIRDVREQVHMLLTTERNRAYTKILHKLVWEFVDPTEKALSAEIAQMMQEFTLLARAVDPTMSLDDAQVQANNETITYAQMLVDGGYGTWKPDTDPDKVRSVLASYQAGKNEAIVAKMFGRKLKSF
jgi:malate synthase